MSLWWNGIHAKLKILWGDTPLQVRVLSATPKGRNEMQNYTLAFTYIDGNPTYSNELTFDVFGKFVQVSLRDTGEWYYFDLDIAQLKELKKFVDDAIIKIGE